MGSGPGSATRRIVATGAAASATRRPSMESCQSPGRNGRLTRTTSSGLGETWGGGADRMDAPSSSMASTVTTGTGFSSVAARPPSSNMPVVTVAIATEAETAPVIDDVRDQPVDELGTPITTDDVLDARLALARFEGDFASLLR